MFATPPCFILFCSYFPPFESPKSSDLISPPLDLRASTHPAAQAGRLPQLQHHPAAAAARRPGGGAFQATAHQGVSHHAALQVRWVGWSAAGFFELKAGNWNVKLKLTCCGRMFERPTPSMHHLSRTHRWEGDTVILTLPSSFLSSKNTWFKAEKVFLPHILISIIHLIHLQLQGLLIWHCWMPNLQKPPGASMWANRSATVSEWTAVCVCPGTPSRRPGLTVAAGRCKRIQLPRSTAGKTWKHSVSLHTCMQRFTYNKYGHSVSVVSSWGRRQWCSSGSTAATTPPTWIRSSGDQTETAAFQQTRARWGSVSVIHCLLTPSPLPQRAQ